MNSAATPAARPMASVTTPRNSAGNGTAGSKDNDNNIMESLAALRSVLMLDTPTRHVLEKSVAQTQQQQQPSVASKPSNIADKSSTTTTTTPAAAVFQRKISELEAAQKDWQCRLERETARRKTLDTTYHALLGHRKELSVQLELVTKSREKAEEELARKVQELNRERALASATVAQERHDDWKAAAKLDALQKDNDWLKEQLCGAEKRRTELDSIIASLKAEAQHLEEKVKSKEAQLGKANEDHLQRQREAERKLQQNEEAKIEAERLVAAYKNDLDAAQQELARSAQLVVDKADLEKKCQEAESAKAAAEQELEEIIPKLEQLNEKVQGAHAEREKAGEQLHTLTSEMGNVREQLSRTAKLQLELKETEEMSVMFEGQVRVMQSELEEAQQREQVLRQQNEELLQRLGDTQNAVEENEYLRERLQKTEEQTLNNDEMLRNMQLELEEARAALGQRRQPETTNPGAVAATVEIPGEDVAKLRAELETVQQALKERDIDIEKLMATLSKTEGVLAEKIKKTNDAEKEKESQTKQLQVDVTKLQEEKATLEEKLQSSKSSNKRYMEELAESRESSRLKEADLVESRARIVELEGQLEELHNENEGMKESDYTSHASEYEDEEEPSPIRKRGISNEDAGNRKRSRQNASNSYDDTEVIDLGDDDDDDDDDDDEDEPAITI